jgi:hypothetical protein
MERKSAPMRGCVTSATTNRHVKSRRNPRLSLGVGGDGSAVGRAEVVVYSCPTLWDELTGYTQRLESVSIRNRNLFVMKRWPGVVAQACAAADVCCASFPLELYVQDCGHF